MTKLHHPGPRTDTYVYDAGGRMITKITAGGEAIRYSYSRVGLMTLKTYPDDTSVTYSYNARGQRMAVEDATTDTTYSYDDAGRLSTVTDSTYSPAKVLRYGYDKTGMRTLLDRPNGADVTYAYDDRGALESIEEGGSERASYLYDDAGALTRLTYGNTAYAQYELDHVGRLTKVSNRRSDATEISGFTYTLDLTGNRLSMAITGTAYTPAAGNLLTSYITPGLDDNLSLTIGSNTYYYLKDGLGSVRNIINLSQTTTNTYDYYAYGAPLGSYSQGVTNRYTYTGREYDSESGLYYYRARYYNGDGRFLSKDPIEPWMYGYVENRPTMLTDALGLITGGSKYACCGAKGAEWKYLHATFHISSGAIATDVADVRSGNNTLMQCCIKILSAGKRTWTRLRL